MVRAHRLLLLVGVSSCIVGAVVAQDRKPFTEADAGESSRSSTLGSSRSDVSKLDRLKEAITEIANKFRELSQELINIAERWSTKGKAAFQKFKQRLSEFNDKLKTWADEHRQKFRDRRKNFKEKIQQKLGKLKIWASSQKEEHDYRFGERKLKNFVMKAFDYLGSKNSDLSASGQEDPQQDAECILDVGQLSGRCSERSSSKDALNEETNRTADEQGFHLEVDRLVEILRTGVSMYEDLGKLAAAEDLQKVTEELHDNFMETVLYALQSLSDFCGTKSHSQDVESLLETFKSAGRDKSTFVQQLISNTVDALDHARIDTREGEASCKQTSQVDSQSIGACASKVCSSVRKILETFGNYMHSRRK